MVYVDELRTRSRRWLRTGVGQVAAASCHLTADSVEELHEFAKVIGLKRSWYQDHPRHPHYDLTAGRRKAALAAGAVEESTRTMLARKRVAR